MVEKTKLNLTIILAAIIIGIFIFLGFYILKPTISGKIIPESTRDSGNFIGNKIVTKIIDGDTIIVEGENVRLLGIDTDESGYPCYKIAKERLEELILNKEVRLEKDQTDKDQYKRYLRYIFLNDENINLKLVEEGLAVARFYPEDVKYKDEIIDAEARARENKLGCKWGGGEQIKEKEPVNKVNNGDWSKLTPDETGLSVVGACNAGNYINKEMIVEGKIADAYRSKTNTIFLNFEKPYPNSCFTAVIFSSSLYKFPENPEDYYNGKTVRIKGKIKEYEGKPEVILENVSQIEVG